MERLTPDDIRQLDLLKLFFKIAAILFAVGICCGLPHTLIGLGFVTSPESMSPNDPGAQLFGGIFAVAGIFVMAAMAAFSWGCWQVLGKLEQGTGFTFITVTSALLCLNMPFGAALGVYSLVTINRPNIRDWLEGKPAAPPAADSNPVASEQGTDDRTQ
ncbi:MAG: hypothetical protein KDC26_00865 [Armatimonadetes bacterium]|nr:hypothetical protein [Armatimonadota bacterium]